MAATFDVLDDVGAIVPMKFRPGQQVAQVMWAQQFQGKAVHLDALMEIDQGRLLPMGLENRQVKTQRAKLSVRYATTEPSCQPTPAAL